MEKEKDRLEGNLTEQLTQIRGQLHKEETSHKKEAQELLNKIREQEEEACKLQLQQEKERALYE